MFKRTILIATAISMLAAPMAQAQQRPDGPRHGHQHAQNYKQGKQFGKHQHLTKKAPKRHAWKRGQKVPNWHRQYQVRDFHRHGLKRPGYGQHWVKIGNEYLLISIATGIILGMAAAR